MPLITADDVFNFMGSDLSNRLGKESFIEDLIEKGESYFENLFNTKLESKSFTQEVLTPESAEIYDQSLHLKGSLIDTYTISAIFENDSELKSSDYLFFDSMGVLKRVNGNWDSEPSNIKLTGIKGFLGENNNTRNLYFLNLLKEHVAIQSRMWTRVLSSQAGDFEGLIMEMSDSSKKMIEEIRNRNF